MRTFHEAFPWGMSLEGTPVESEVDFPMFAMESLDKLVHSILIPILTHKRHSSMTTTSSALNIGFIRESLPEIEQLYKHEVPIFIVIFCDQSTADEAARRRI